MMVFKSCFKLFKANCHYMETMTSKSQSINLNAQNLNQLINQSQPNFSPQ